MHADDIERAASEWLSRLDRGELSDEVRAAFDTWYAADPRHQLAFLRLQHTWQRLDRLAALRPREELRRATSLRHWARQPAWRWLTAAVLIATLSTSLRWLVPDATRPEIYSTNIGGFERIPLQDGSVLELNTQTEVSVELTARARTVRLKRGEATFKVAHDAARPFVVTVEDTAVRAVGTEFNVRRRAASIEVLVLDGKVAVGPPHTLVSRATQLPRSTPILQAGSIAIAGPRGLEIREIGAAEARRRLAWQAGMLSFDGQRLAEVAAEFSRYDRRQVIVDPALASMRIGGQFRATNLEGFVTVLERSRGVRVSIETDRIILKRGAATVESAPTR